MSNDAAGWRPDPFSGPGWQRYWDGRKFTAQVRNTPVAETPTPAAPLVAAEAAPTLAAEGAPTDASAGADVAEAAPTDAPGLRLVPPATPTPDQRRPRPASAPPDAAARAGTPVPPRDERKAAEARTRRRRAAGREAVDRPVRGGRIGLWALLGAVAAVVVAALTSGSGHDHRSTSTASPPSSATIGSSLPSATDPVTSITAPALPTSTAAPTTAVKVCPTGAVTVSLSLAATPAGTGQWSVTLKGSATNTATGALRLDAVVADVRDGNGTVIGTISALIADRDLPPHFSTSLSGSGQVASAKPPTVTFGNAAATWTGPGTASCPVPH
ncbi:MAG TPA: DUF2510 domain-containing protein [Acidimicrobiales bacterium]|nr:DUF2510 domain-containing protein [Acidimicrobiales bacterium]